MDGMVGYCGYNCGGCPARSDDREVRAKLVEAWRKLFGHQNYTAENVQCHGCKGDGLLADKTCPVRPCAIARGIEMCPECDEFPCKKLAPLMASREALLVQLYPRTHRLTEEEYDLAMRQFDSMANLVEGLVRAGKLLPWCMRCVVPSDPERTRE